MENKKNKEEEKKSQLKHGDKVIIGETIENKKLGIAGEPGVVDRIDGEEVYVLYVGLFGPSGPYKLKIDEVEKV